MVVASGFGPNGPSTTVIVSTFNQPRELELVLASLACQTDPAFDVIVADDGSEPEASKRVDALRADLPFAIQTVWQENAGFRKARVLNLAALRTQAELLVFLDGDCTPFRNLIEVYRRFATPGGFLVGGVGFLSEEATRALTPQGVRRGEHERLPTRERLRMLSIHAKNLLHAGGKLTRPRIRGGNFAVTSALFHRVNGFDEVYCGYGKEDSDLRNRMRNAGARGRSLWHRAFAVHPARSTLGTVTRLNAPPELYERGRSLVEARSGLRAHTGGA